MNLSQDQNAKQVGERIQSHMEQLQSFLQMARNNLSSEQKQEIAQQMEKTMGDLLATSFDQEKLMKQTKQISTASSQMNNLAKAQMQLRYSTLQIINQLVDISQKTFFLSPQMSQVMSGILMNQQNTIGQLENRNPRGASKSQQQAMAGLNQALLTLQQSMNQMNQASSASGFQEYLQELQKMAGQQGQVNEQTLNLFNLNQREGRQALSSDALARLAAQQEVVRNSLEKLNEVAGNRRDILGRMDELVGDMEEIIKDLKTQKLDRKVIQRQEAILSRLLDAQKSVREKEYSKKRQAKTGQNVLVKSPPQLREELLRKEDFLRKELMNAIQEGYPAEYREYIRKYFEILTRQNQNTGDMQ
jgi:hypothetical protein